LCARGGERVKPAQIEGEGVWRVLAKHPGALFAYHVENGDPGRLRCGLLARDAGWLDATAAAIADALGEPLSGPGGKGGAAPDEEETDADA
jgi:hypothetical protein